MNLFYSDLFSQPYYQRQENYSGNVKKSNDWQRDSEKDETITDIYNDSSNNFAIFCHRHFPAKLSST